MFAPVILAQRGSSAEGVKKLNTMKGNSFKSRAGIVYSTRTDFDYQTESVEAPSTLPKENQPLKISIDRRNRKGKTVTLISGFCGTPDDLDQICKVLKMRCGVGGSAKDGLILLQGDLRQKVFTTLIAEGYKKSKIQWSIHLTTEKAKPQKV
jgi:translation initiation factor 1